VGVLGTGVGGDEDEGMGGGVAGLVVRIAERPAEREAVE